MITTQIKLLHSMLKNQWKSYPTLRKMQNNKLRKLIDHAYTHVPYYKDLFESNHLKPDDIRQTDDLTIIPVSTKKDIQNAPLDKIISQIHRRSKLIKISTSGSSGDPLQPRTLRPSRPLLHLSHLPIRRPLRPGRLGRRLRPLRRSR